MTDHYPRDPLGYGAEPKQGDTRAASVQTAHTHPQ